MASNVVAHLDAKDNIYPRKERAENKIDGIVALIMALSRAIKPGDSVVLGSGADAVMVKWQLDAVESPAPDRLLALAGTGITPDVRAIVRWRGGDGAERTLMTAADYLPGADDGWTWAVELVRAHAQGAGVDAITPFARIGELAGHMHVAFSTNGITELSPTEVAALETAAFADLTSACELMDGEEGDRLLERKDQIAERLARLTAIGPTPAIDIHGDFHVGQIIESADGAYLIVDFDGNPVQTPAERLLKQPAARDIAGMLASIDHVARVVNYRTPGLDPRPALIWIAHAQEAFLAQYQQVLTAHGLRNVLDDRLIAPFMMQQEMREYIYSARHLPHWRYVPDAVITSEFPTSRSDN
jgi:maltokinase